MREFSPCAPAFSDASNVNSTAFPLHPDGIEELFRSHPHRVRLVNGTRWAWGFSLMSDGAARMQMFPSPERSADEPI